MRGQKKAEDEAQETGSLKAVFARTWSSDRGVFVAGSRAELPANIARSLEAESVVVIEE